MPPKENFMLFMHTRWCGDTRICWLVRNLDLLYTISDLHVDKTSSPINNRGQWCRWIFWTTEHPPWWPYSKLHEWLFGSARLQKEEKTAKRRTFKKWTPKTRIIPKPKIMFGRLSCIFLKGYISIRIHFQGGYKSKTKNKDRPHFALPTSTTKLLSCQATGNFNSTPSKVKDPEKDNMPIAWKGSWVNDDQTHKTWRITKCTFLCQHLKNTKSSWWFQPIHLKKMFVNMDMDSFPKDRGENTKLFATTT